MWMHWQLWPKFAPEETILTCPLAWDMPGDPRSPVSVWSCCELPWPVLAFGSGSRKASENKDSKSCPAKDGQRRWWLSCIALWYEGSYRLIQVSVLSFGGAAGSCFCFIWNNYVYIGWDRGRDLGLMVTILRKRGWSFWPCRGIHAEWSLCLIWPAWLYLQKESRYEYRHLQLLLISP